MIAAQFPQWSDLPVTPVEIDGWDNRTYRLGDEMTARLPTAAGYVPAIDKEHQWLPRLASSLPVPIPAIVAKGAPGEGYPFPWSIRGWIEGETAAQGRIDDMTQFATSVAEFLLALQRCDATEGPLGGEHSWSIRGLPVAGFPHRLRTSDEPDRPPGDAWGQSPQQSPDAPEHPSITHGDHALIVPVAASPSSSPPKRPGAEEDRPLAL
ncbi:phosphotransferase [Nonomuraea sp. H19]|uniref:phosphotransferase n=1 Tax=Nonomuraea sp. H19 TaxID=3452206 RepID=UPI003F8BFFF1